VSSESFGELPEALAQWAAAKGLACCQWSRAQDVEVKEEEGTDTTLSQERILNFVGGIPLWPVVDTEIVGAEMGGTADGRVRVFFAGCDTNPVPQHRTCSWIERFAHRQEPPRDPVGELTGRTP